MNTEEYARMRDVEDRHWWYGALRRLVWDEWCRVRSAETPAGKVVPVAQVSSPRNFPTPKPATSHSIEPPQAGSLRHRRILDIGCGTGGTLAAAPCVGVGIDRSLDALRFCRERGQHFVAQAEAALLPFADASFSGALLLDVLYHRAVSDPGAVLREAHRVIAPGSYLIVNVPAYEWLRSSHDEAIHTERRFTRTQLRALLSSVGFHVSRATYWNTLLFPAIAAVRVMRRGTHREASDIADYRLGLASTLAGVLLRLESEILGAIDLPFGLSILAVARKL